MRIRFKLLFLWKYFKIKYYNIYMWYLFNEFEI